MRFEIQTTRISVSRQDPKDLPGAPDSGYDRIRHSERPPNSDTTGSDVPKDIPLGSDSDHECLDMIRKASDADPIRKHPNIR